ncbi:MAG TPA: tail fiber domain-containing protein [Panacibacter sp.]|nr:tail fiber domain-containing protein [Panacibacter sp.]
MKTTITYIKTAFNKHAVIAFLGMLPVFYGAKTNAQTGVTKYGTNALVNNSVTGIYNSAFGYYSLNLNTTGTKNSASGANVLRFNTTGSQNTGSGYASLYSNTTGNYNTGYGAYSLFLNTTGAYNCANGYYSLNSNTIGGYNTANGYMALFNNTTGYGNTANGSSSLNSNITGTGNTANGSNSLFTNATGSFNTANGFSSLSLNTTGGVNTANGYYSLSSNTTGKSNTAIGEGSLINNTTGNYNTAIGSNANTSNGNLSNATAIGYTATVDASNKVRIGNTAVTSIGGEVSWTTFSDGRYKKDIKENVPGLSFINSLRPVTYTVNITGLNEYFNKGKKSLPENETNEKADAEIERGITEAGKMIHSGFIAQEVEAAATKLNFTFSGVDKPQSKDGLYGLRYDNFVMPLVKAVQELSAENNDLKARLEKIEQTISANNAQQNSSISLNTADGLAAASLDQNAPNPFNGSTVIRYRVPSFAAKAQIVITNTAGNTVKAFTITTKGAGSVSINGGELSAGSYYYTLIIDGKKADSKQMILVK